jgi:iron(III) transport system substrate-binding protein
MRQLTALVVIAALAGAAQVRAEEKSWDAVIAAAKAEGQVVVYSGFLGAPSTKAVAEAFRAKYGITIDVLEVRASELRERVRVEHAAGRSIADLMYTSESQAKIIDWEDKTVAPLPPLPNADHIREAFRTKASLAPVMTIAYGVLVNTRLVKPADEPKSWFDLTDPKWRGKILSDDMRAVGGGSAMFTATYTRLGPALHEKLATQELKFTRDYRDAARRIARGEFAIYMPFILSDTLNLKGLPVKPIVPAEGAVYVLYGNTPLVGAPHPNAARLYMDFMLSDEVQLIYAREGETVVMEGLIDKISPQARELAEVKLLGTSDPTRQTEMLDHAKAIYK